MKLVSHDDPILVKKASLVEFSDRDISKIVCLMLRMMITNKGCGLAAPQVGVPLRIFTLYHEGKMGSIINPVITYRNPELIETTEGCLTFPNKFWKVKRSKDIVASYQDLTGKQFTDIKVDGFTAVIFQHEYDHLEGVLVSQHAELIER